MRVSLASVLRLVLVQNGLQYCRDLEAPRDEYCQMVRLDGPDDRSGSVSSDK